MKGIILPKKKLEYLYVVEKINIGVIAKMYKCSSQTVRNNLTSQGIKLRTANEQRAVDKLKERGVDVTKEYGQCEEGQPINCTMQGGKCIYKIKVPGELKGACDYLSIVGHSRGCDPDNCTKYKFRR